MVDIDRNSTLPRMGSNRNSPKNEYENDENNNGAPQQENGAETSQYANVNQGTLSTSASRRGSTRSRSPTASINSQASVRSKASNRSQITTLPRDESPPPVMPYPKANLLIYPDEKYTCPKCNCLLCNPVQNQVCGHRFCYQCYKDLLSQSEEAKCPIDEKELDPEIPKVDTAFKNEIEELDLKCKNYEWNCKWEGTILNLADHLDLCEYTEVLCSFDCGTKLQRRYQNKHLDKDCPKQLVTCPYCTARHIREDKKEHLGECPKLPLPCPNKCDKKFTIEREGLEAHMDNECPRTKILCHYESIGCPHRASREKMPKHYSKETATHVKMIYEMLVNQGENLKRHEESLRVNEETLALQEKRIGDLEKIAHSQLIWRIEDYTRKMKDSKSGNVDSLFSPTFVTSKHGYRLCVSACLNGDGKGKGSHMSVFISVLKGQYDALLKWPFEYRVTFYLLDQNEEISERKHIKFSIKPNPCAENEPFLGRPKMEKNASFGGAKFAKHEDIEEGGYIKDDVIYLKIAVDCDGLSEP